jgi:hypothetical protein
MLGLSDVLHLGNGFYGRLPKEIRVMAIKDMAKMVGFGLSVLALIKLVNGCPDDCKDCKGCANVETDPRSSDFGKIKIDNTRYDIWGGFQPYITFFTKFMLKQKITVGDDRVKDLNGKGTGITTQMELALSFLRGKLAPIPATAVDYLSGRTQDYKPFSWKAEAQNKLLPLISSDLKEAYKEEGVKALFTVGLPATFGVGVNTYEPNTKK